MAGEFEFVAQAARTGTTGTQDYTFSGFGTPKAVAFFATLGTAIGTAVNSGLFLCGFTDGSRNVGHCSVAADNLDTSIDSQIYNAVDCIVLVDPATGTVIARAQFSAWITNGVRINWSVVPGSGYQIVALLIGGAGVPNAYAGIASISATNLVAVTKTIGFRPSVILTLAPRTDAGQNVVANGASFCMGWAVDNGAGTPFQHHHSLSGYYGQATSTVRGEINNAAAFNNEFIAIYATVGNFTSTGFDTIRQSGTGSATEMPFLAIELSGLRAKSLSLNGPTTTTPYAVTGVGWTPQLALIACHDLTAENRSNSDTISFFLATASAQYSFAVFNDDAQNFTNVESQTDNNALTVRNNNALWQQESWIGFNGDGLDLDPTTFQGTVYKRGGLFIEKASVPDSFTKLEIRAAP